jgi:TolA-binding protein
LAVALVMTPLAAWAAVTKIVPWISGDKWLNSSAPRSPVPSQPQPPRRKHVLAAPVPEAATSAPGPEAPSIPSEPEPAQLAPSRPHAPLPAARRTPRAAPASAARQTLPNASAEFREAMNALSRGDFGSSASKLASFAAAYPGDSRAEDAVYLEAVALERAGRMIDAVAAARRYLSRYPEGAHQAQARRLAGD